MHVCIADIPSNATPTFIASIIHDNFMNREDIDVWVQQKEFFVALSHQANIICPTEAVLGQADYLRT